MPKALLPWAKSTQAVEETIGLAPLAASLGVWIPEAGGGIKQLLTIESSHGDHPHLKTPVSVGFRAVRYLAGMRNYRVERDSAALGSQRSADVDYCSRT
jgi:hypothetical protein